MTGYGLVPRWQNAVASLQSVPCPVCGELITVEETARREHIEECERLTETKALPMMTAGEARTCVDEIIGHLKTARARILELYEREGWKALGYASWRECVTAEFGQSQSYLYRQLAAAFVERVISPMGEIGIMPERQAREFNGLAPDEQKALAALSKAVLGDKPTASGINGLRDLSQSLLASGAITVDGDSVKLSDVLDYSLTQEQHERLLRQKQHIADEKTARRSQKVAAINAQELPPLDSTPRKFAVIYADPPWRYDYSLSDSRAIENQYPTMEVEDICSLPVSGICTDNAVLFLWATSPKLVEALRVIEAWDFTYRTCMVWDKARMGMGYYARQQHELLLIATRGDMPTPEPAVRPASVIRIERTETHSQKPVEFRHLIETMYPEFQRIELFAREVPDNWYAWGNEAL